MDAFADISHNKMINLREKSYSKSESENKLA